MNKLLLIGFIFMQCFCYAQKFENIGVEKGLSAHQAYDIVEDYNGFIWVSTKNGIDRYNGETISNYKIFDDNNLSPFRLFKLAKDTKGNVWAYTVDNIYKFIEGKNKFELQINFKEITGELIDISHLVIKDVLWISTNKGLYKYHYENNSFIEIPLFKNKKIDLVFAFDNDKLLVAQSDHVVFFDTTSEASKTILQKENKAEYRWIRSVFWDGDINEAWIGTRDGEVYVYNFITSNTIRLKSKIPQLPSVPVNKIVSLQEAIFIGSDGGGVFKISKKEKTLIENYREDEDDDKSLTGNGVQDLLISSSNHLLVSTFTGGLNVLNNQDAQFLTIRHQLNNPNSLNNNVVNSLLDDKDGDMWFATNNGISCWLKSENKWVHYLEDKNNANVFLSLFQYDDNSIMAGSYSKGLYIIDKNLGVISNILPGKDNPNNFAPSDYIVEIFRDVDGKIWTGGPFKDLAIYNPKSDKYNYLPIIGVNSIQEKDDEHIFIGTSSGLFVVNIHSLNFYKADFDGVFSENLYINSINYDKQNTTLWIASRNGIIKWNLNTNDFKKLSKKEGMPSNHVYAILRHSTESIWASTEKGIIRYNIKNNTIRIFTIKDGLSDESFYKNSKLKDKNGNFYFGSYSGVTYFNPDYIELKKNDIALYFENLLINNKIVSTNEDKTPLKTSLNKTEQLNFDYNQNSFSFNFTSVFKLGASEIKYSWMLENQDEDWTIPSLNNNANYTNLSEGNYVFKLRAIGNNNNDEVFDERIIGVHIKVAPWNSLWARLFYFILFTLILASIIRYNITYNKKKLSEAKVKFFINTAHDIRTPLTLASAPLKDLYESNNLDNRDRYHLDLSISSLNKLTESINHLLDFQKADLGKIRLILSKVDVIDIIKNKINYFSSIAEKKNINLDFICELDELFEFVDYSKFDKILDNLLSNAYKYTSKEGIIEVSLASNNKFWTIEIKDTGIGIPVDAQKNLFKRYFRGANAINSKITGTGIGLLLVRDYVRLHKGKVDFKSEEGVGTTFTISFLHGEEHYDNNVTYSDIPEITATTIDNDKSKVLFEENLKEKKSKLKLMIVEDNDRLRGYLENSMKRHYNTKSAENGKIAFEMVEKFIPDIIVSDIGMPEMDGIELTNKLKSKYETSHIPIILLTAFKEKGHIIKGLDAGADDYITKPFDTTLLLARIQNIINNRQLVKNRFLQLTNIKLEENIYTNQRDQEFVERAIAFVEKNMMNPKLSKKYFAQEMFVSQTILYQKLKTLTDQPPNQFIKIIRLRHAAKILKEKDYTISEVANLSGFSDSKYFSTCFKQFFGKSPSNF